MIALGWNTNGSLGSLSITDPFNSPDTQNCTYTHDDLARLQKANCGSTRGESYSYDPFGNIDTSVLSGSAGFTFQPTYTHGTTNTNQYFSLPGFTPTYDANGNLLTDSFHTYTWDAEGKMISLDSTTLTYDALGRMVEQNQSGTYFQIVYSPRGKKLAIMKAQVIQQSFVSLPGKAKAEYLSWGLSHYRHPDWLGSSRLESSTTHGIIQSVAYDAFGVPYAQKSGGNGEISFTGQNKDTAWLQYDFLDRQYDPTQGRWISPDRSGLKAVDYTSPQSWNRYAYVQNNPLAMVDPFGDDACYDPNGNQVGSGSGVVPGICESLTTGNYTWLSVPAGYTPHTTGNGTGWNYTDPNGNTVYRNANGQLPALTGDGNPSDQSATNSDPPCKVGNCTYTIYTKPLFPADNACEGGHKANGQPATFVSVWDCVGNAADCAQNRGPYQDSCSDAGNTPMECTYACMVQSACSYTCQCCNYQ